MLPLRSIAHPAGEDSTPGPPRGSQKSPGLAFEVQANSCGHGQALGPTEPVHPLAGVAGRTERVWAGGRPRPLPPAVSRPGGSLRWACRLCQPPTPGGRGKAGTGRGHKEARAAGALAWLPVPLEALAACRADFRCFPTPTPASFPRSMWLSCFLKRLFVPSPSPPRACTQILRNIRSRGGAGCSTSERPRPCLVGAQH